MYPQDLQLGQPLPDRVSRGEGKEERLPCPLSQDGQETTALRDLTRLIAQKGHNVQEKYPILVQGMQYA